MSAILQEFIDTLGPIVTGKLEGTAKLAINGIGAVMLDHSGAREGDDAADVTLKADEQVFRNIMDGSQNPVTAFMSGKLKVDGSTTRALKVSSILVA